MPGTVNALTNINISSFAMDSVCLRIIATKDTSIEIKPISNLNCFVDKSEIWAPTVFSPNNDGKNDLFKVYARNVRGDDPNPNYRSYCKIYNRWGQKVFETNDFNIGWDGTFEGNAIPNGLYIVKVFAVGYDGEPFRYSGTLNVER